MDEPLAALARMPGTNGMRLLLKAVEKAIDERELVNKAETAISELEHLVLREIGDWKSLEAVLSGWLPDAREQFELNNRQMAFRAMGNLRGVMADAEVSVTLLHPSQESKKWVDRAGITGICRMRRLRRGTPIDLLHGSCISPPANVQRLSLDDELIAATHGPPFLREFSTSPTPTLDVRVDGEIVHYLQSGGEIGVSSSADLFFADVMRKRYPANGSISDMPATPGAVVDVPVKTLIIDVLVHEDVWPGVQPELRVYDTARHGLANPIDPARDMDRLDVLDSIQDLGSSLSRFRTSVVADYCDLIRCVCDKLGWDSGRFRGFRYKIEYPIYGTQVSMIFRPPPPTPLPGLDVLD